MSHVTREGPSFAFSEGNELDTAYPLRYPQSANGAKEHIPNTKASGKKLYNSLLTAQVSATGACATLIAIHNKTPRIIGLAIIIALVATAIVLMVKHSGTLYDSSHTDSSSSQFNTLFQPNVVSKKLHCRTIGALPDVACTPGTMITGLTKEHVCTPGYEQSAAALSEAQKRMAYSAYDIALHAPDQYQIDHLISIKLGGSNDAANLWPQAGEPKPGYKEKDAVEEELHKRVCEGRMSLNDAQRIIATDWVGFYKTMAE